MSHGIVQAQPLLEELFGEAAEAIGDDLTAYRNHAYRVFNFCVALYESKGDRIDRDMIAVAAHFHDLGIWTDATFDYLAPSIARATAYLERSGRSDWTAAISLMIAEHHKLTSLKSPDRRIIEAFRRADWIDVTLGLRSMGLDRSYIREVRAQFPNDGFHARLVALGLNHCRSHPLRPLPMFRW